MGGRPKQLELPIVTKVAPTWGGRRKGAGRKPANPLARPNVPHRSRPVHKGRLPVHVTMRANRSVPSFRTELVRNLFKTVLRQQRKRAYADRFQVVHFSIQSDHLHLIVEAIVPGEPTEKNTRTARSAIARRRIDAEARDALRRGVSGLAISFARRLNRMVRRRGSVWSDRHHRRDLTTPTEVRSTILYVLQNYVRHGARTFGAGVVDIYSSAPQFDGFRDPQAMIIETEPWPVVTPFTWMLGRGWTRAGGLLATSDHPPAAKSANQASIVKAYVPSATMDD